MAASYGNSVFNFSGNPSPGFHRSLAVPQPHRQGTRAPVSPHRRQPWRSSRFFGTSRPRGCAVESLWFSLTFVRASFPEKSLISPCPVCLFLLLSCPTRNVRPHCPSALDRSPRPPNRSVRALPDLLPSHPKNSLLDNPVAL